METIEQLDRSIFLALNSYHNDWLDVIMWHISGKLEWIPFYILLIYLVIKKFGKQSVIILSAAVVLIVLCDQVSVALFKNTFQRYRPCHNLEIADMVQLVNNKCGGKFGFVSSHATNTFGLATFIGLLFNRKALFIMFIWASIVSYSRVYLGVHYPLDVLGGAILGIVLAYSVYFWMINLFKEKLKPYVKS